MQHEQLSVLPYHVLTVANYSPPPPFWINRIALNMSGFDPSVPALFARRHADSIGFLLLGPMMLYRYVVSSKVAPLIAKIIRWVYEVQRCDRVTYGSYAPETVFIACGSGDAHSYEALDLTISS